MAGQFLPTAMHRGELRIVGGLWGSRRIRFPASPGLRPTPDRLRETLFNWLGEWVVGRRVLDLYAGSGALGIEALSRGAGEAIFVESDPLAARAIGENLERLGASAAKVERADAHAWLASQRGAFDLVFLDPPYAQTVGSSVLVALSAGAFLAPDHRVYLEQSVAEAAESLPAGWELLRASRAGDAHGRLLRLEGGRSRGLLGTPN